MLERIIVNGNSTSPVIATILRYVLMAGAGFFVSKGYLNDGDAETIVGGIVAVLVALYGAYITYRNNEQKKVLASVVPDSVATVK